MSRSNLVHLLCMAAVVVLGGCIVRPVEEASDGPNGELTRSFPLRLEKDVDILFVIDNSGSMEGEQQNLSRNFPKLIEALRTQKLQGKIPNVHIGVVTTDLGSGPYTQACKVPGGDGGRLQATPRKATCTPPSKPWIEYIDGKTNITAGAADPIQRVKDAFSCIAEVGTSGCGFEQPLEAARRALDPKLKLNQGFLRQEAYLAIVFITDEDDCSAAKPQLYDPSATQLGQLGDFRCFEYGVECNINGRKPGPRKNCKPAGTWLHKVGDYISFFKGLKPPGRVMISALAGPADDVTVLTEGDGFDLKKSCTFGSQGAADPAIRLKAVVDGFGTKGQFSTICTGDYGPALKRLGDMIITNLDNCIEAPLLTRQGAVACKAGDTLGQDYNGKAVTCQQGCLEQADCVVRQLSTSGAQTTEIPRCDPTIFNNPSTQDCGGRCPCWRIINKATCTRGETGPGYALEVLRRGVAPAGSSAMMKCYTSVVPWGSPDFATLPQCY